MTGTHVVHLLCVCVCVQDAFSLLAYSDPWNCPVGQQLDPTQRESLCSALNSAILGKSYVQDTHTHTHTNCVHTISAEGESLLLCFVSKASRYGYSSQWSQMRI